MGKIQVLTPDVAALIAAGEVVERPSSVIKELIENSLDANASHITVEIKNGGITYMRVTDNGDGISRDDIPKAFLRHATSKISCADDLESIKSLGFRGEALYSIATVSHLSILTKCEGEEGNSASVNEDGQVQIDAAGCPKGTTVVVKDLFYNTPARMKFLKKDSTEAGYIEDLVKRTALGSPHVSFRYINNGKEIFFTVGDGVLKNTVYSIYGKNIALAMINAEYEEEGIKVYGMIGKSELSRPNRSMQTFFVNGRCVINKSLYVAVNEGYKNQIMAGRFPVCVLNIEINPSQCDVNVHPSKAEIKFTNDKLVYDGVYWAIKNALYKVDETRSFEIEPSRESTRQEVYSDIPIKEKIHKADPVNISVSDTPINKKPEFTYKPTYITPAEHQPVKRDLPVQEKMTVSKSTDYKFEKGEEKVQEDIPIRIIGQAFDTYIIVQSNDEIMFVDQHAAHERLIYDKLLAQINQKEADSQMLLAPVTKWISASEIALFEENKEFLQDMGFDAEIFGDNTVRISAVPSALANDDAADALLEILEALTSSKKDVRTKAQQYSLYRAACRAALKAGKKLDIRESEELVRKIMQTEGQPTCPHGRPAILRLTKSQIEKQFKRIV